MIGSGPNITAILIFVSFVAAKITPVAQFGVAAPIGVLLALCYSLTLLPALLAVLPNNPALIHPGRNR